MSTQKPIRLALIGLGNQGQEHLKAAALLESVVFVAGVDSNAGILDQVKSRFGHLNLGLHNQISELQHYALDGLILALPHHCYRDAWQEILALGLPLLKEKPLGRTLDEARNLLAQAHASGCPLQTAIQRRHHPSYQALKQELSVQRATALEVHAHLHLGFAHQSEDASWRSQQSMSGGGVLLDAGYHMVDLLHYLAGPFDLVTASLWRKGRALGAHEIEDEAYIVGRSENTWVMLESRLTGEPDVSTGSGYRKSEGIRILTDQGLFFADRQGVYHNDAPIGNYTKEWSIAMAQQLDQFASNIRFERWNASIIWDQLPAMQLIEQAYKQAFRY